jgi:DNA-binding CsgD family transcriptional regulator
MPLRRTVYTVQDMTAPPAPTAEVLAQVADALAWPLFLMRADGFLLHANLAGRELLRKGRVLHLSPENRVEAAAVRRRPALTEALQTAASRQQRVVLHAATGKAGFAATVTPLPSAPGGSGPLLLALTPGDVPGSDSDEFAALHGLTAAETRVMRRLALGESSSRAAHALGVKPATVRTQVVSIRRKTGHASVAELLQALAAVPPLRSPAAPAGAARRR